MQTLNPYLAPLLHQTDLFFNDFPLTSEHQLIKHLQVNKVVPFDGFELANTQDLFNAHFLCMHVLYHLKNHYNEEKKFCLDIQSVRIERINLASSASKEEGITTKLDLKDPLASYYLNPKHYFETQEYEINDMLKLFWEKYLAQEGKVEALNILGLKADADASMVKAKYKQLAQKHHPDKGGCAEMFNKIRQAKSRLDLIF